MLDVEMALADVAGIVRLDEVLVEVARVVEPLVAEVACGVPEEAGACCGVVAWWEGRMRGWLASMIQDRPTDIDRETGTGGSKASVTHAPVAGVALVPVPRQIPARVEHLLAQKALLVLQAHVAEEEVVRGPQVLAERPHRPALRAAVWCGLCGVWLGVR